MPPRDGSNDDTPGHPAGGVFLFPPPPPPPVSIPCRKPSETVPFATIPTLTHPRPTPSDLTPDSSATILPRFVTPAPTMNDRGGIVPPTGAIVRSDNLPTDFRHSDEQSPGHPKARFLGP